MTTIATDGKSMAGDGCVSGNGIRHALDFRKVFRLKDGRIVGCAGVSYAIPSFLTWLEAGGDLPELNPDFEALVLHADGRCLSYNHKGYSIEQPTPAVTGSGGAIALGAMLAGASPAKAVAIACERDTGTGGTITAEVLA